MSAHIILLHHKLVTPLGSPILFFILDFMIFLRIFLVPLFPFGFVSFLLLTGLSSKFIVADLVPVSNFFYFFPYLPRLEHLIC